MAAFGARETPVARALAVPYRQARRSPRLRLVHPLAPCWRRAGCSEGFMSCVSRDRPVLPAFLLFPCLSPPAARTGSSAASRAAPSAARPVPAFWQLPADRSWSARRPVPWVVPPSARSPTSARSTSDRSARTTAAAPAGAGGTAPSPHSSREPDRPRNRHAVGGGRFRGFELARLVQAPDFARSFPMNPSALGYRHQRKSLVNITILKVSIKYLPQSGHILARYERTIPAARSRRHRAATGRTEICLFRKTPARACSGA